MPKYGKTNASTDGDGKFTCVRFSFSLHRLYISFILENIYIQIFVPVIYLWRHIYNV